VTAVAAGNAEWYDLVLWRSRDVGELEARMDRAVRSPRRRGFDNAEQAADAAFALLADYAAERASLKAMVDRAIADDQWVTPEDLDRDIESHFAKHEARGGRL
jgi:hypothetical protein